MNEDTNATDALLDELKNLNVYPANDISTDTAIISATIESLSPPITGFPSKITEDNLNDFIFSKNEELINTTLDVINSLKNTVAGTQDAKSMSGFAEIIKAFTGAMDTLNNINIEKRKAKNTKEIKELDANNKKMLSENQKPNNTFNIVAGRETIMKMLKASEPAFDAEYKVIPE